MGEMVNGWQIACDLGRYGTKYAYRAAWTFFAVGDNLVEEVADGTLETASGEADELTSTARPEHLINRCTHHEGPFRSD